MTLFSKTTNISTPNRDASISVELLLVSIIAVAALIVAFVCMRDATISELADMAGSVDDLNQSFTYTGAASQSATSPGSNFVDGTDSEDSPDDVAGEIDTWIVFTDPTDELGPPLVSLQFEAEGPDVSVTTGAPDPNGWNIFSNGQVFVQTDIPEDGTYRFKVRLWGQQGGADLPNAALLVDGVAQADFDVSETSFANAGEYFVDVNLTAGSHQFGVEFTNDFLSGSIDRNLLVDFLMIVGPN